MALPLNLVSALLAALFAAQDQPADRHDDLIHSDVPLWAAEFAGVWPRAFSDSDGFGCANRLRNGDWRYEEPGERSPTWYRLTSRNVIHCVMRVRDADERENLGGVHPVPSFLINLGTASGPQGSIELWILQRGARPGSDYLLLARTPAPGLVSSFDVLQRECPRGRMRRGPELNGLMTRYCAINDRRELTQLARRMAQRPPLGRLTFMESVEDEADNE